MRTTLDLESDLLSAVRQIAQHEGSTAGRVISRLLRAALTGQPALTAPGRKAATRNIGAAGFRPFAPRGTPVTNADIDRLRDAEGI